MEDFERSPVKQTKFQKTMIKNFYNCIFEDTLVSIILKFHRELAFGNATNICDGETDLNLSTNSIEHYDIFGHENGSKRSIECKCFVCHRLIAAARFMPHLEKCIGIGRNSRVTRRKIPNYVENMLSGKPSNMRARSTSSNLTNDLYETYDVINDDDDEWSNSTNSSRKRPKTRSTRSTKNPY